MLPLLSVSLLLGPDNSPVCICLSAVSPSAVTHSRLILFVVWFAFRIFLTFSSVSSRTLPTLTQQYDGCLSSLFATSSNPCLPLCFAFRLPPFPFPSGVEPLPVPAAGYLSE